MVAYKFSPEGKLLLTIGKKGVKGDNDSHDTFNGMADLVVAKNGDIFIADGEGPNTRIVKFSKDGTFIKWWGGKGTEPAFTGAYWDSHEPGVYHCAACGLALFSAKTKFDSGTGWPSFYAPISEANIIKNTDSTLGMARTEIRCRRCGSHLGHVFDDGPAPTGLRYCMNSAALQFEKQN